MTKKKLSRDLGWLTSKPKIIATGYDLTVYDLPDKTLFSLASEPGEHNFIGTDKFRESERGKQYLTYRPGATTILYDDEGKELVRTEKLIVFPTGSICVFEDGKYVLHDPEGKELFREETFPLPETPTYTWEEGRASYALFGAKHRDPGPFEADISDKLYAGALDRGGWPPTERFLLWLVFKEEKRVKKDKK